MVTFDSLRAAVAALAPAAPSMVDDERAKRIAHAVAMTAHALDKIEGARTPERLTNRAPAARRVLERLANELACEGAAGWAELVVPVRVALARAIAALAVVEATAKEANERIAAALREAA